MTNTDQDFDRGAAIVRKIWSGVLKADRENEAREAAKDPKAYRNSQVMSNGTEFRYWHSKTAKKGHIVSWCYSKHKNVAGFYLSWIEIWKGKYGKRFNFHGHETKAAAKENCYLRFVDSKKPRAERRFTIPSF